jgi:hypothetical protein
MHGPLYATVVVTEGNGKTRILNGATARVDAGVLYVTIPEDDWKVYAWAPGMWAGFVAEKFIRNVG